ncbi:hypothetical protein LCGC14_2434450, partial [marine sediment metagenome]
MRIPSASAELWEFRLEEAASLIWSLSRVSCEVTSDDGAGVILELTITLAQSADAGR